MSAIESALSSAAEEGENETISVDKIDSEDEEGGTVTPVGKTVKVRGETTKAPSSSATELSAVPQTSRSVSSAPRRSFFITDILSSSSTSSSSDDKTEHRTFSAFRPLRVPHSVFPSLHCSSLSDRHPRRTGLSTEDNSKSSGEPDIKNNPLFNVSKDDISDDDHDDDDEDEDDIGKYM